MAGEEMIQIGEGRGHPFTKGLIILTPQERVEPDQSLHLSFQIFHLRIEKDGISSIPTVAKEKENGSLGI